MKFLKRNCKNSNSSLELLNQWPMIQSAFQVLEFAKMFRLSCPIHDHNQHVLDMYTTIYQNNYIWSVIDLYEAVTFKFGVMLTKLNF